MSVREHPLAETELLEHAQAVGRDIEKHAALVVRRRSGLIDLRVPARPAQEQRDRRTRYPAPDDHRTTREGPMTPSEVATRSGLTAGGAITAVIDRLEKAGLAERTRDTVDRRRVLVTPNAQALYARVGTVYTRVGQRWNDYLATLQDDQIALACDVIAHAAELNRQEIESLRSASQPSG
jgi:DNA-binding MarR family transcriptional regulator